MKSDLTLTTEVEADKITVPFTCPTCELEVEATVADPLDLLFGGGTIELVCPICDTTYQADISMEDNE